MFQYSIVELLTDDAVRSGRYHWNDDVKRSRRLETRGEGRHGKTAIRRVKTNRSEGTVLNLRHVPSDSLVATSDPGCASTGSSDGVSGRGRSRTARDDHERLAAPLDALTVRGDCA